VVSHWLLYPTWSPMTYSASYGGLLVPRSKSSDPMIVEWIESRHVWRDHWLGGLRCSYAPFVLDRLHPLMYYITPDISVQEQIKDTVRGLLEQRSSHSRPINLGRYSFLPPSLCCSLEIGSTIDKANALDLALPERDPCSDAVHPLHLVARVYFFRCGADTSSKSMASMLRR
jgi:hypothetical protein